jgi:ribosomal protein L37AE/L43A/predicted Ser/Thr protein kinase
MNFACPSCGKEFEAVRPESGHAVQCPACRYTFADTDSTILDISPPPKSDSLEAGRVLAGFRVEELIGRGAMGVIYRATQLSLDRIVALKVLPGAFADNEKFVDRFHKESGALSALSHPNVVTIFDRGHVGRTYFFVMEYVDGPSLRDVLEGPIDVYQFLRIAKGTAAALSYAHEQGVVHRDIKPSNIMLTSRGEVKIADFGLAGIMRQEMADASTGRPTVMGTPAYMSPEQKRDSLRVDGRTDIYSAGVVFYEALAGMKPDIPLSRPPSALAASADPRLDPIVDRCLKEVPGERYQSAQELLSDLEHFEADLRRAPPCPSCGKNNPVRAEVCTHCGADLEELFDVCPECMGRNRREVRRCLHCGADLERGRTIITQKVTLMLEQADKLRLGGNYTEALQILNEVDSIEGRAFEEERQRATLLKEKTVSERIKAARTAYREGRRMLAERRFREAIELFKSVPADIKDTAKEVEMARQMQATLAAQMRSQATTNLVLLAVGLVMIVVIALLLILRP